MTEDLEIRLVVAFEQIAEALTGIHETNERQFAKQWPEPRERREAVVTRVPTEEDLIREKHGSSEESLEQWLIPPDEDIIGPREREFLARQKQEKTATEEPNTAVAAAFGTAQPDGGSAEAPESQA